MQKAIIEMENGGKMTLELHPEHAPETVANFVKLAGQGFYDGLIFHRVIEGFMIQGGDPTGTGRGGPGYQIHGEFAANGVNNTLKHTRGVISMARAMDPNSAGSQFFIMHQDAPHLDGRYAGRNRRNGNGLLRPPDSRTENQIHHNSRGITPQHQNAV